MKKRLFSVLMALVMVFSIFPTFVFAETGDTFTVEAMSGNMTKPVMVYYRVLTEDAGGGTVAVSAAPNASTAVPTDTTGLVLPDTVKNNGKTYTVTELDDGVFQGCTSLNWIGLPKNLTKIGARAFKGAGLLDIDIPTSVTSIGDNAFRDCSYLHIFISGSKTPAKLGEDVFTNCSPDLSIDIPNGTKQAYINAGWPKDCLEEYYLFKGNILDTYSNSISGATVSVYDVNGKLKGSVKTDEYGYFDATDFVEYGVEQTAKIEKDGYMAMSMNFIPYFYAITDTFYTVVLAKADIGFSANTIEGAPITYQILTKDETNKTGTARVVYGPGSLYDGSITLPNTVTYDGITYTVTEIGDNTFSDHYNLTSITLPSSLENIGKHAFTQMPSLLYIISNHKTPVQANRRMFVGSAGSYIYIPAGTKQAYIDAGWPEDRLTFKEVEFSNLSGKVLDENGNGIADAKVTIYNDSGYQESVYTDSDGKYSFNNYFLNGEFVNSYVENGCNKIKAEKAGYQESVVDLGLFEGDMTNVEITLSPAPVVPSTPTNTNNPNDANPTQTSINNTPQTGDNSGTIIYIALSCMLIAILAAGCVVVAKRRKNEI